MIHGRTVLRIARSTRRKRVRLGNPHVERLSPRTRSELGWWVALSLSAGFCEEFVFRGYLIWAFGPPNRMVDTVEYLIALHVTSLIRDGGTLQIGIGALEDAVTYLLKLRHTQNDLYSEVLTESEVLKRFGEIIERLGETGPFERGLYAS